MNSYTYRQTYTRTDDRLIRDHSTDQKHLYYKAISEYITSASKGRISVICLMFAKSKYVLSVEFVITFNMIDDA